MFPTEIICHVQNPQYQIQETLYSTFYTETIGLLIFDNVSKKYNFYVIVYEPNPSAASTVKDGNIQSLEFAQVNFPNYNLTEENYGF